MTLTAVAVDRASGALYVAWQNARPGSLVDAYFLGDYDGLAITGGAFVPLFSATRRDPGDKTSVFVRPAR